MGGGTYEARRMAPLPDMFEEISGKRPCGGALERRIQEVPSDSPEYQLLQIMRQVLKHGTRYSPPSRCFQCCLPPRSHTFYMNVYCLCTNPLRAYKPRCVLQSLVTSSSGNAKVETGTKKRRCACMDVTV
jgi:hypothetical protein